ncbi:MAG: type IV secretory system conjugative DNA transfer family protein, partial [Oscillospiraceae bacterium]|nr:type IV secretory system conjugative DNA transfer family protein [Oscillospiraceae bacterium]
MVSTTMSSWRRMCSWCSTESSVRRMSLFRSKKTEESEKTLSIDQVKRMKQKGRKIKPMLNLNMMILGGSGTGKSRFFVKPNLMQCNTSYVVTDPSGELLQSCGKMLERMGYKIKVFNINDMKHSSNYNPFHYLRGYDGKINNNNVIKMINVFMMNTKGEGQSADPFWDDATRLLLS